MQPITLHPDQRPSGPETKLKPLPQERIELSFFIWLEHFFVGIVIILPDIAVALKGQYLSHLGIMV